MLYLLETYSDGKTNLSPDCKVQGANMGPTWVLSAPDGPPCWPHEPCYQDRSRIAGLVPLPAWFLLVDMLTEIVNPIFSRGW